AIVDRRAELDRDVEIGPYCVVGAGVKIGRGTKLQSHLAIKGRTTLGDNNTIFPFASVGSIPQDLKYKGEPSELLIGNGNTIREYVSLNPGTSGGGMVTRVGDQNLLMMYCHIAHDCIVGNRNVIANGATLGGHVIVEDNVIVGGLVGIHQFVRIGTGAILGAGSMVSMDVPPYCNATGDRARLHGLNLEGLKRRGFDKSTVAAIRKAYRIAFQSNLRTEEALRKIRQDLPAIPEVEKFVEFIAGSQRGICR
ncbi:MAG TPA: acyl-ACP--UDP-N-acetylglucosamine O-acyltransferase, partial [Candidatus Limnocylindria bacterium]|nr:acyl-ACP--UDP-N-acetylglucosamine O-acyltransferase [Candidatus Limnocylindria bacterium]